MPERGNRWQFAAMAAFTALNFSQILWKVVFKQSSYLPMLTLVVICMALGWFMHHMLQSKQGKVGILARQRRALLDRSNDSLRHESPRHNSLGHESLHHEALPNLRNEALRRDNVRQQNLRDGLRHETHSCLSTERLDQRDKSNRESGLDRRFGPRFMLHASCQHQGNESAQMSATLARRNSTRIPKHHSSLNESMRAKLNAFTESQIPRTAQPAVGHDQSEKEMRRTDSETGRHAFAHETSFSDSLDDETTLDDSDIMSEVSSGGAFTDIGCVRSAGV